MRPREQVADFYLGGRLRHVKRRCSSGMFKGSREARFLWCPGGRAGAALELSIWQPSWDKPPKWWSTARWNTRIKVEVSV